MIYVRFALCLCRLSVIGLSSVTFVRLPQTVELFASLLHNSSETWAVLLKFWAKIPRDFRGSCKLNIRGMKKLAFFNQYLDLFRKRYNIRLVTMKDEEELVCGLSNGVISNDLQ